MKSSQIILALTTCGFSAAACFAANAEWDQAIKLYSAGRYKEALTAFQKVAEKDQREPKVHYMLGQCYKSLNNAKQAKSELEWVSKYAADGKLRANAAAALAQMSGGSPSTPPADSAAKPPAAVAVAAAAPSQPPPTDFVNDSPQQTVTVAAQRGWIPCKNSECLNFGTQGWHHAHMENHPDSDQWMDYKTADSQTQMWSQKHIGHTIKEGKDVGVCPSCGGTGWIKK